MKLELSSIVELGGSPLPPLDVQEFIDLSSISFGGHIHKYITREQVSIWRGLNDLMEEEQQKSFRRI